MIKLFCDWTNTFSIMSICTEREIYYFCKRSALSDAQGSGGVTSTRGIEEMCGCGT